MDIEKERTLVLLKPDALRRNLAGEIISRFEKKGLQIIAMKMIRLNSELAKMHYHFLVEEDFFSEIEAYITSGPIIAMLLEGRQAIQITRRLVGSTDGALAAPGTIRGDYTMSYRQNLVHASDSVESYERESALFFPNEDEIFY